MNKKGQLMIVGGILFIVVIIGILCLINILFLNHGSSIDIAYGVEQNTFWSKLYLKDDHTTVYCMDDDNLIQIAKQASQEKLKVKVTYQEYIFRGTLCNLFNDKYNGVVVTNIEVIS